jgi:protein-S-isoprenylcysteine O-methyltransferase Ste14
MLRIGLFLAGSLAIGIVSRRSLANPRAHGFYRFFAFELLIGLILLNAPVWLDDPFSLRQVLSYAFGIASMALAIEGFRLLRVIGKPVATAGTRSDLPFEKTTKLVTVGAYRFIRHPLYASLLALSWCAYLKDPVSIAGTALAVGATVFLTVTAVVEETENLARFGTAYSDYMKQTRRFIPSHLRHLPPA